MSTTINLHPPALLPLPALQAQFEEDRRIGAQLRRLWHLGRHRPRRRSPIYTLATPFPSSKIGAAGRQAGTGLEQFNASDGLENGWNIGDSNFETFTYLFVPAHISA
ncbi:hypothetical protein BDZ89DRAFT_1136486 [Hymenopellis radicata]|nr:hypothetical protein BDZ89DRAFT_1136486 [Hymenopellis radicata]